GEGSARHIRMRVFKTSNRSYSERVGRNINIDGECLMTPAPYVQLIAVKRWADLGLYEVLNRDFEKLTEADATLMLRILDHIHTVDRIFQHHLQGVAHTFKAPRSEKMPPLAELARSAKEVGDWYASYVADLDNRDIEEPIDFTFTSGKRARMQR